MDFALNPSFWDFTIFGSCRPRIPYASARPCNRAECAACTPAGSGPANYLACKTSPYTKCEEVQLTPLSNSAPAPTAGGLAGAGRQLATAAVVGDFLAGETESDETPWWLLKVASTQEDVPANYLCPDLHCDVKFENYGDTRLQRKAIKVQRLRPEVTGRGQDSSFYFTIDSTIAPFFFPSHLLRSKVDPEMSTRNVRAGSGRGFVGVERAKITAEVKREINGKCRVYDNSF